MRLRDLCLVGPFRKKEYMGEETFGLEKKQKILELGAGEAQKRENSIKIENERFREQSSKLQVGSCYRDPPNRRHGKNERLLKSRQPYWIPPALSQVDRSF